MSVDRKRQKLKWLLLLMVTLGLLFIWYGNYIELAKCTIPYSDYFQWTARYGEKLVNNSLKFKDYFESDGGEHIQPLVLILTIKILKATGFDYGALVVWGLFTRCTIAALLSLYCFWNLNKIRLSFPDAYICSVIVAFALLNFNQWEITTESFSFGNTVRLTVYFISFVASDRWISGIKKRGFKENIVYGCLLGVGLSCCTLSVGGGYFVGHIITIGIVFCYQLIKNFKDAQQYTVPLLLWSVTTLAGCVAYIALIYSGERQEAVTLSIDVLGIILGVVLYWGAAFIPIDYVADSYKAVLCAVVGTIALITIFVLVCEYLYGKKEPSTNFPIYCIIYANVIAFVIATARISAFSYDTMASSRYAIESTIGIVGVVWLLGNFIVANNVGIERRIFHMTCLAAIVVVLSFSAKYEITRAPYIRQYYDNLEIQLIDYQNCSDETLETISATDAERARKCLAFLQREHLSIFKQ